MGHKINNCFPFSLNLLFHEQEEEINNNNDDNNNNNTKIYELTTEIFEKVSDCAKDKIRDFNKISELEKNNKLEILKVRRLGKLVNQPWNPSELLCKKCTAFVRFSVNRPISIISYGFFGPFDIDIDSKTQDKYQHIEYYMEIELLSDSYQKIASTSRITSIVKSEEIFHVKFDNPVPILPSTWYLAKFSLMGPPTGQSRKILSNVTVYNELRTCNFKFEGPDSLQMPEIAYVLRY